MSEEQHEPELADLHDELVEQMRLAEGNAELDESQQELARAWRERLEEVRCRAEAPLSVAFMAQVGRGKSTLIAAATGLRLDVEGSPKKWSVLPVNGGRTTLGETEIVHEAREDVVLEVEPMPRKELLRELSLFAEDSWAAATAGKAGPADQAGEELYGLLRAWLVPNKEDRRGHIAELAKASGSAEELKERLLDDLDLEARTGRYTQVFTHDAEGLAELQGTLKQLMRGQLEGAPAPQTVRLHVPVGPFGGAIARLVDTRGIDSDAPGLSIKARSDLRRHIEDPDTLLVVCSEFESAPDVVSRKLVEELGEQAKRGLEREWRLVIVDRRERDEDPGERREQQLLGKERLAQCRDQLRRAELEVPDEAIVLIDARHEGEELRTMLVGLVEEERARRASEWARVHREAKDAFSELEAIEFAVQARELDLRLWWIWDEVVELREPLPETDGLCGVSSGLWMGLNLEHWSHLYAASRRRGRYSKLDLARVGAQFAAALAIGSWSEAVLKIEEFAVRSTPHSSDRLASHVEFRARQFWSANEKLLNDLAGRWYQRLVDYFESPQADELWRWCEARWGQGSGYVQAIADRFRDEAQRAQLELGGDPLPPLSEAGFPPRPDLFRLREAKLDNFRSVEHRTIPISSAVTALVGDNGLGKTGWLEAIAATVGVLLPGIGAGPAPELHAGDVRQLVTRQGGVANRRYQVPMSIGVEATLQGRRLTWSRSVEEAPRDGQIVEATPADEDALHLKAREIAADIGKELQTETERQLPVLAYYGTQRLWPTDIVADDGRGEVGSRLDGYRDCLQAASTHEHMLEWMRKYTQVDIQRKARNKQPVTQLRAVERAVLACVPEAEAFYYDLDLEDLVLDLESGETMPFRLLSDGYRNIVAMVADIAWRASRLNPQLGASAPALAEGVVLIDEIDLHLHPKWQRRIIGDLRRAFPKLQFVVTTHSPFIVQSLDAGQLVNLDPDAPEVDYVDLSPEDITEQVMGVEQPQRSERRKREAEVARRYYELLDRMPDADAAELARLEAELDELTAPYDDNQAFVVFLERKRALAKEAGSR